MAVGSVATRSRTARRSWTQSAIGSWVTTTDHKKIGIMYIYTAFFFFLVGGVLAMPIWTGFGNYLVPLMIGARDMAFPRINALGYWLFLIGGIVLSLSFVFNSAPNAGWFSYAPLTEATPTCLTQGLASAQAQAALAAQTAANGGQGCFSAGANPDFWIVGINILG